MLVTVLLTLSLVFQVQHAASMHNTGESQYISSKEQESLRNRLYSELSDTKKEVESLKNDLQYWKNETLNILKMYLLDVMKASGDDKVQEKQNNDVTVQSDFCNIKQEIIFEVSEIMYSSERSQSQELREVITETSCCQQPLGTFHNPAPSCKDIPEGEASGKYWIQNAGTGYASQEYCDMDEGRCCNTSTGGWMRVAQLNMTDPDNNCPSTFKIIDSPKRTCGRPGSGCYSTSFSVNGISYSRVCGMIKAYQFSSTDAFDSYYNNRGKTIDDVYVDGISLTHGQNPRKHIWTFASALDESRSTQWVCPCTKSDTPFTGVVPPFIGNDYFCDTGSRSTYAYRFYSDDPLWDGAGCEGSSTCCQFNNPPWFCKKLPEPTTDDIELRLCADEYYTNEDAAIEIVELYVQ